MVLDSDLNSEQKEAVLVSSGCLLQAGAGSGKTKVIVAHFFYKVACFLNSFPENQKNDKKQLQQHLKEFLSTIVLLTFTKNAALEMVNRIKDKCNEDYLLSRDIWSEVFDSIRVSTIHSFCLQMIRSGFIYNVSPEAELVSEWQRFEVIRELFSAWVSKNKKLLDNDFLFEVIVSNKNSILDSLNEIFNDAVKREYWIQEGDISKEKISKRFFCDLDSIFGFSEIFQIDLEGLVLNEKKNSRSDILREIAQKLRAQKIESFGLEGLKVLVDVLEDKRLTSPKEKGSESLERIWNKIKDFKQFFVNKTPVATANKSSVFEFFDNFEIFKEYAKFFTKLVQDIDISYNKLGKLTFTDLEYYVYQALKDDLVCDYLNKEFRYFIIDEYQDTSLIQYQIIRKLIKDDFQRLFAVGDMKQAIYGFRGGELAVFCDTAKNVRKNLTLQNNYRSSSQIINFNNDFFSSLFEKKNSYTDPLVSIDYLRQKIPDGDRSNGTVKIWELHDQQKDDLNLEKIDKKIIENLEAEILLKSLKEGISLYGKDSFVVLYPRLDAIFPLLYLLKLSNLSFKTQLKIKYDDSPLFILLNKLLEQFLSKSYIESDLDSLVFIFQKLLMILLKDGDYRLERSKIAYFFKNIPTLGVWNSFLYLLHSLPLSIDSFETELKLLKEICNFCLDDVEKIYNFMSNHKNKRFSLNYHYGENPQITIMTAHASKGLEFDHLFLGGLYRTSNRQQTKKDFLGAFPCSFKWKTAFSGASLKSPDLIIEENIQKRKEQSELDRLLYVALTRTKKTLNLIRISPFFEDHKKENWIKKICEHIQSVKSEMEMTQMNQSDLLSSQKTEQKDLFIPSLFYYDYPFGIVQPIVTSGSYLNPLVLSELSVTSLATIVDCPRRYYLKNILKIGDEDLTEIFRNQEKAKIISSEISSPAISTKERGTDIHNQLAHLIEGKIKINDISDDIKDFVITLTHNLKKLKSEYSFLSEKEMKFRIKGHMVTGRPDLVLIPHNSANVQIWDFKTGKKEDLKEKSYWFQLYCYAYGLYELGKLDKEAQIKLKIIYLDESEINERLVERKFISDEIESELLKTEDLSKTNIHFCHFCEFQNICHN